MFTETGHQTKILLGEDESEVRSYLAMALKCHGYAVELAENGSEVLQMVKEEDRNISAVLLDILMPQRDGLETLREIRRFSSLPVIMLSGATSPLNIVEAMKNGANDFLGKPVSHEDLVKAIEKAISSSNGARARTAGPPPLAEARDGILLDSPRMREMRQMLQQIGSSDVPVLIQGETGSGKEVLARQLHAYSRRAQKPFLKLNCAALPSELVESELFGYERGAFTGAFQKKPGMFEMADGGTLLLDEIGDMDFKLQAKLLQVLQDQEFRRIGGKEVVRVDVRVLAATHRDLEKAIAGGAFREDLYYRLNVIAVRVPALRERREEILPLAEFFLRKYAQGGPIPPRTPALQKALEAYAWPGNIRELENLMRKFLVVRDSRMVLQELNMRSLPRQTTAPTAEPIFHQVNRVKEQAETEAILAALAATSWNRKRAAALLNVDYKALLYKMKKLSIEEKASRGSPFHTGPEAKAEPDAVAPKRRLHAGASGSMGSA